MRDFVFTSSSVLPGHPDKLCDRISDAIVDAYLASDPHARVAAECAIASDVVFLVCHASPNSAVDHSTIARNVIREVGYRAPELDPDRVAIMINLAAIDVRTVDDEDGGALLRLPASNSATLFGYACRQTADLMPAPIRLAHRLAQNLWAESLKEENDWLGPDGQVQASVEYRDRKPARLVRLTVLAGDPSNSDGAAWLGEHLAAVARDAEIVPVDETSAVEVNPPGAVLLGGPRRHPGLTGRKISVDTYGDFARQGSSALSGKDPHRIDRIGAYAARYAAKNIVAAQLAAECEVQLSYAVGRSDPVSVAIDTRGTGVAPEHVIVNVLRENFDLRPGAIIDRFGLHDASTCDGSFYRRLSAFGQVGERSFEIPWEKTDLAEVLAAAPV